jgi:hypothetical protein
VKEQFNVGSVDFSTPDDGDIGYPHKKDWTLS